MDAQVSLTLKDLGQVARYVRSGVLRDDDRRGEIVGKRSG